MVNQRRHTVSANASPVRLGPVVRAKEKVLLVKMRYLVFLVLVSTSAIAQPTPIKGGEYIAEQGTGYLSIKRGPGGKYRFSISSAHINGHMCDADGEIDGQQAVLDTEGRGKCIVKFIPKGDDIDVAVNDEQICHYFCGMRASGFDGLYLKPPSGCTINEVKKRRSEFKRLFVQKKFSQAQALLSTILNDCSKILDSRTDGWIRNDLALTYYKLNDRESCLKTLQPLAESAALSDQELEEEYGIRPMDLASDLPIIKATRTNLKLCK